MYLSPCAEKRNSSHMQFPITECRLLFYYLRNVLILRDVFYHKSKKKNFPATTFLTSLIQKIIFEKYTSFYCIDVFQPEIGWVGILEHAAHFRCSIAKFGYLLSSFIMFVHNRTAPSGRVTRIYFLWRFLTIVYDTWGRSTSGLCQSPTEGVVA